MGHRDSRESSIDALGFSAHIALKLSSEEKRELLVSEAWALNQPLKKSINCLRNNKFE
jgi:hypothetical protein